VSPTCQRPASRVIVTDSRSEVREFLASRRSRTTHQQAGVELIAFTFLLGVGATSWELYRDGERPNQVFRVSPGKNTSASTRVASLQPTK
jgi:hypothetical protein